MKPVASTKVRIAGAATSVAKQSGLANLTVGEAAKAAGVSTALVHYHFDTKQALLVAVAEAAMSSAVESLSQALAHGRGLETVDRVWERAQAEAAGGGGRLLAELASRAMGDAQVAAAVGRGMAASRSALAARLPELARELGASLAVPVDEAAAALAALLDGLILAMVAGTSVPDVRAAYDAFWLTLIAADQGARRR